MSLIFTLIAGISFIYMILGTPLEDMPIRHQTSLAYIITFVIKYSAILIWIMILILGGIEFLLISGAFYESQFNWLIINTIISSIFFLLILLLLYASVEVREDLTIMKNIAVIVFWRLFEPIVGVIIISVVFSLKFR